VIVLLTFVTIGMAVGALLQLAFLKQLEESSRSEIDIFHQMDQDSSLNKTTGFPSVYSIWKNDEDARILRIGMVGEISLLLCLDSVNDWFKKAEQDCLTTG
jgi:prolyl 4-hydroxylase